MLGCRSFNETNENLSSATGFEASNDVIKISPGDRIVCDFAKFVKNKISRINIKLALFIELMDDLM
ncbi:hypothetical protein GCM10007332_21620 [Epilithonimonas arachidiradicis]|uniref:Uncharacterized protein n=1 Tax=Epilithonimonas arachidiradicis TaxID=1617282 RepID=A0ABQ1X4I8_9FLAO|nr:hypothetical protein GCM10007332_21620 [Epilithonimonas arachidiradicis]